MLWIKLITEHIKILQKEIYWIYITGTRYMKYIGYSYTIKKHNLTKAHDLTPCSIIHHDSKYENHFMIEC